MLPFYLGRTPLHIAAAANDYSKAKSLLKKNANMMDIDNKGWNAMHVAALSGSYKCVQLFLSRKGWDIYYFDNFLLYLYVFLYPLSISSVNVHCLTNNQDSVFSLLARLEEFDTQPLLNCLRALLSMNANVGGFF